MPNTGKPRNTIFDYLLLSSLLGLLIVAFIFLAAIGVDSLRRSPIQTSASIAFAPVVPTQPHKPMSLSAIDVLVNWSKSGFGNVMIANLAVNNENYGAIKDFEVSCILYAKSKTAVGIVKKRIYDVVSARSSKKFDSINMGFIHDQAESCRCTVTDSQMIN